MREFLERSAPANNLKRIKASTMLIHGQNDVRVPVDEVNVSVSILKRKRIPTWYLLAKNEGHEWSNRSDWDFRSYCIALFVQEHLMK
jgi:dipeptidyl aminopeptidase/acylaminoacyl peptidase